jgi:hypothetical protein
LEFLKKYQREIFRFCGAGLLFVGFIIHFWVTPKQGLSQSEIAAANVARMEASVTHKNSASVKKQKVADPSHIAKALKATREKQITYLTYFAMIIGALFLGYSFLKKEES